MNEIKSIEEFFETKEKIKTDDIAAAKLPKASPLPATKRVEKIEDFDRRIVATAIRNAVTKAIVHIAGRSPELATERDVQIEQLLLDTLLKEINPEVDYSGGRKSIEQREG